MLKIKSNILNIKDPDTGRYGPISHITGESAYEIAKRNGYKGTEADWRKETSGTVEYVDTAGISNRANAFVDESIGSDSQPIYFGPKGNPVPIKFNLGNGCELNATDDINVDERCVVTTVGLSKAFHDLYSKGVVPTVNGSLVYNGTVQTPTFLNFDKRVTSVKGTTSATNAGAYTAIFTPKAPYSWVDGTNVPVDVKWYIEKATFVLSASINSVTLTKNQNKSTITLSKNGDGSLEIINSDPSIASVSIIEGNVVVEGNGTNNGSTMVKITVKEGTNYKESNTVNLSVKTNYE